MSDSHIPECDGNGHVHCWECTGTGWLGAHEDGDGYLYPEVPCVVCNGSGYVSTAECCPGCRAEGAA